MSARTFPALQALLEDSNAYPKSDGQVGFTINRDRLIAVLQECTPRLQSISVVPDHVGDGDMTSFKITVYASFARSELLEVVQ